MTSTVWLLDIDGVINAATLRPPTHAWPDWIDTKATDAKRQWRILAARDDAVDLHRTERTELEAIGPVLIVAPDPQTGLCKRHLRDIDTFLTAAADAP